MTHAHLVVDLSGHGFGHAGMTIPLLNAVRQEHPDLRLTLRTTVPRAWLAERLDGPFDYVLEADFGMAMADAMRVLPRESFERYRERHAAWKETVEAAAERLAALQPTLLLSNVSYLALAAAERLGIPRLACCSLNWADVFRHYCGGLDGADAIWRQMAQAYAAAEVFLQPAPSMPMPSIANGKAIGPVARLGRDRRRELRHRLGIADDVILALVTLGGIPFDLASSAWPRLDGMRAILTTGESVAHPDIVPLGSLPFPFTDVLRSCDVVVTKTGYGTLTEAVCNGTPILHAPRPDWPETPALSAWIERHGRTERLAEEKLRCGAFAAEARAVLALPAKPPPAPTGIAAAAAEIGGRLVAGRFILRGR